ncbi:YecH family protein [Shewanella submarina]|uniref:YecH family metal-binding protein n=1 Tax=Shewanella submarina TaxID=2016376 RepID=A0ABV7GEF4_9GAMM|nr:YecH family metal-binding protein [Shewanella submarina]MCL1037741.1 YecH family protein [Shewanella submarina]
MIKSVHGHDVMALMQAQQKPVSAKELRALMIAEFGADTQYHTCSKEGMSADELIDFLRSKKKFLESESGWEVDARRICNH